MSEKENNQENQLDVNNSCGPDLEDYRTDLDTPDLIEDNPDLDLDDTDLEDYGNEFVGDERDLDPEEDKEMWEIDDDEADLYNDDDEENWETKIIETENEWEDEEAIDPDRDIDRHPLDKQYGDDSIDSSLNCEEEIHFNLTAFFEELSIKRGFIEVTGLTRKLETDGKKYKLSDFKFSTRYIGKHDYFRIIFNHDTKLCTIHVQIKTNVLSKYDITQNAAFTYIYMNL